MAGTRAGGLKAAETLKKKDEDHFRKIGSQGGKNNTANLFKPGSRRAKQLGRLGGLKSKRA